MSYYFESILRTAVDRYGVMEPPDAVKLCYQSAYGPGHMVGKDSLPRLIAEARSVRLLYDDPTFEALGERFCRVNLGSYPADRVPLELLDRAFHMAGRFQGDLFTFERYLHILKRMTLAGEMPFTPGMLEHFMADYRRAGCPAIHHSEGYWDVYQPAYRVVDTAFAHFFPLIEAVCDRLKTGEPFWVGVDGQCGAGKSYLARYIQELMGCPVVRMDDFFLPEAAKTPQRLAQPGGNADHERFAEEVLPHLGKGEAFSYRRFNCQTQQLDPEPVQIPAAPWVLVEGSYCLYPPALDQAPVSVFMTATDDLRVQRIRKRSPQVSERYEQEWIPLEDAYFDWLNLSQRCTFLFDTTLMGMAHCQEEAPHP